MTSHRGDIDRGGLRPGRRSGTWGLEAVLIALVLASSLAAMMVGRLSLPPMQIVKIVVSRFWTIQHTWPDTLASVVWDVRLPRMLAGLLVGGGLAIAGTAFQGLFRNPLVSPHILGVSAGAGFGAAAAILLVGTVWAIQAFSFIFGLGAVFCTYMLSRVYRATPILMLVLAGIIVGGLFSAATSLLKYMADPVNQMPSIVFWLLGSLNNVSNRDLLTTAPLFIFGIVSLLLVRWQINLLSMGEDEARALGVNTGRLRLLIIFSATIIAAASVSLSGIIGWIGLVIPHIGRFLVGPDNRRLMPVSLLIGAAYLVTVDTVSRSLVQTEIPIGILTAMVGAPIFAFLLRKNRTGWQDGDRADRREGFGVRIRRRPAGF